MFAGVKIVVALVVAGGSVIAVVVESTHPGFVTCLCVAFAVGVIAGEVVKARRRRAVRWLGRRADFAGPIRIGRAPDIQSGA